MLKVNIINRSAHSLPSYESEHSAGMDLKANIQESITLHPGERQLISTGLYIEIPPGYEGQVRPRSGLAIRYGITVLNSPGTVDADYRGEIKVILINLSSGPFIINDGDRIAQLVIARHEKVEWQVTDELAETGRGRGGFGSTGK